ncbi:MAG: hypothetical protein IH600_00190 [Bacteroidetes bacterium]|nr:hypothetical protein [Bacteroidota bacterium]
MMQRHLHSFLTGLFLLIFSGCSAPLVHYIGHTYPETDHVDMYLLQDSIPRAYRVMGTLQAEASMGYEAENVQAYVLDYAREHGAHGVIIEGLEVIEEDPVHVTEITEKTKAASDAKTQTVQDSVKARDARRGSSKDAGAQRTTTNTQQDAQAVKTTTVQERVVRPRRIQLNATLIRYE